MILLAVETSGRQASVALAFPDGRIEERLPEALGRRHAGALISEVDRLLMDHQLRVEDISAVAVSIGPGSFTGLRVGLVFAKTFAWINHIPLVAVDTLQAIAVRAPMQAERVTVLVDAQRGEMFCGDYRLTGQGSLRQAEGPIRIVRPEDLDPACVLTGPAADFADVDSSQESPATTDPSLVIPGDPDEEVMRRCVPAHLRDPRASTVALVGLGMVAGEQFSDPATLEPMYVRRSYAEEKRP